MVTAPVRREVVRAKVTRGLSERRALTVVRMSASSPEGWRPDISSSATGNSSASSAKKLAIACVTKEEASYGEIHAGTHRESRAARPHSRRTESGPHAAL
jgi:hypothetical protein